MTSSARQPRSTVPRRPRDTAALALPPISDHGFTATVMSVQGSQCQIRLETPGVQPLHTAVIATHIPMLQSGQRVWVIHPAPDAFLVTAAWPLPDATPLYQFDEATGTLHIQAPRLTLSAIGQVNLSCGDAQVQLHIDGRAHIQGKDILSTAIGNNRIEGASIDFN